MNSLLVWFLLRLQHALRVAGVLFFTLCFVVFFTRSGTDWYSVLGQWSGLWVDLRLPGGLAVRGCRGMLALGADAGEQVGGGFVGATFAAGECGCCRHQFAAERLRENCMRELVGHSVRLSGESYSPSGHVVPLACGGADRDDGLTARFVELVRRNRSGTGYRKTSLRETPAIQSFETALPTRREVSTQGLTRLEFRSSFSVDDKDLNL